MRRRRLDRAAEHALQARTTGREFGRSPRSVGPISREFERPSGAEGLARPTKPPSGERDLIVLEIAVEKIGRRHRRT